MKTESFFLNSIASNITVSEPENTSNNKAHLKLKYKAEIGNSIQRFVVNCVMVDINS